jgi:DNA-directed RNA polymerase subunit H (RpoH/RPB5)
MHRMHTTHRLVPFEKRKKRVLDDMGITLEDLQHIRKKSE